MISNLPSTNLVFGTEKYLRGPVGLGRLTGLGDKDIMGLGDSSAKAVAGEYRVGSGQYYLLVIAEYKDANTANAAQDKLMQYFQDQQWQTVMMQPMAKGQHPRGFSQKKFTAFWVSGSQLYWIWDCDSQAQLNAAMGQNNQ